MKKIIITIDGHSGCGKSTLAKSLARKLNFLYIDSGAMYRAISLFFERSNFILADGALKNGFLELMTNAHIDFSKPNENGVSYVRLNNEIVEEEIRKVKISNLVSEVSKNPYVRKRMVALQQSYGLENNVIMDGRDIGSVVFPDADLKFWLTASVEKRAYRRWLEYQNNGESILLEKVIENLKFRDENDEMRKESPLVIPLNSIKIDNSDLDIYQTYVHTLNHIKQHLKL